MGYQEWLIKYCEFLSLLGGRGMFYIFQGSLWLTFANSLAELFEITIACALIFIGVLHIVAHYGFMPGDIIKKLQGKKDRNMLISYSMILFLTKLKHSIRQAYH